MLTNWDNIPSLKLGDYTLEFEISPPGPELQEVAKKELRETPEIQHESIAQLRELLKGKVSFANTDRRYYVFLFESSKISLRYDTRSNS